MIARSTFRIYLASRSPRRRELLQQIGVAFDTLIFRGGAREDPEVDETPLPGESPDDYVVRLARDKARYGRNLLLTRRLVAQPVLSADTTVALDKEIFGKPDDAAHAVAMLRKLSGRTHRVLTGVALAYGDQINSALSISEVRFRALSDEDIASYVASSEPFDKAGSYGIQGRAGAFVEHLSGSYTGVMGLPLCETDALLRAARQSSGLA